MRNLPDRLEDLCTFLLQAHKIQYNEQFKFLQSSDQEIILFRYNEYQISQNSTLIT